MPGKDPIFLGLTLAAPPISIFFFLFLSQLPLLDSFRMFFPGEVPALSQRLRLSAQKSPRPCSEQLKPVSCSLFTFYTRLCWCLGVARLVTVDLV